MNRKSLIYYRSAFQIRCLSAQQVQLVIARWPRGLSFFTIYPHSEGAWDVLIEPDSRESQVVPLRPHDDGIWKTALDLEPGEYRYCFHAYDGRSLTYLLPTDARIDGLKAVLHVGYDPATTNATSNQERTAHEPRSHRRDRPPSGWRDPLLRRAQRH